MAKNFESKPIKEESKNLFQQNQHHQINQISYQPTNYLMAPTSPNLYITRKLNNMDEARIMKAERDNWTRIYHKTLKSLEAMIDVQRQIKEMLKIIVEMNITMMEMEDSILTASINN